MNYTPRRTKDQWQRILDDYLSSGLTVKAYCEQKNIKYSSFTKWKQLLKPRSSVSQVSSLIKINPPEINTPQVTHQTLTYTRPEGEALTWDAGVDPNYIAHILRVI